MTTSKLPVACPRCSFTIELSAERVAQGPITRTCPACGLLFRVGRGSESDYPEDPVYETSSGWYLRKADGTVLYFPDLRVLQIWASDGMISLTDEISKKGVDWKRVHDLPEFASLAMSTGSPKDSTAVLPRPSQYNEDGQNPEDILTELEFIDPTSGRRNVLYITVAFIVGCIGTWFLVGVLSSGEDPLPPSSQKPTDTPAAVIDSPNPESSFDAISSTAVSPTDAGTKREEVSEIKDTQADADNEVPEESASRPKKKLRRARNLRSQSVYVGQIERVRRGSHTTS